MIVSPFVVLRQIDAAPPQADGASSPAFALALQVPFACAPVAHTTVSHHHANTQKEKMNHHGIAFPLKIKQNKTKQNKQTKK